MGSFRSDDVGDLWRDGTVFKIKSLPQDPDYITQLFAIEPGLTASARPSDRSPRDGGLREADYANPPQGGNGTV
jgi:hypothetical protein